MRWYLYTDRSVYVLSYDAHYDRKDTDMDKMTHNLDGIVEGVNHDKRLDGEVFFTKNEREFVINKNGLFEIVSGGRLYIYLGESDD